MFNLWLQHQAACSTFSRCLSLLLCGFSDLFLAEQFIASCPTLFLTGKDQGRWNKTQTSQSQILLALGPPSSLSISSRQSIVNPDLAFIGSWANEPHVRSNDDDTDLLGGFVTSTLAAKTDTDQRDTNTSSLDSAESNEQSNPLKEGLPMPRFIESYERHEYLAYRLANEGHEIIMANDEDQSK